MVLPPSGLNDRGEGGFQAEQPLLGKEDVAPALMIGKCVKEKLSAQ